MNRNSYLADLPMVEVLLIPAIYVLIAGLNALLDLQLESQSACAASCACIETTP